MEWFLKTKWGNIALVGWGDSRKPGVLLVHGYMDSAAVFQPLVSLLPDCYHYVSFDFPGHGKSDHVATCQPVSQTLVVEIIKEIVNHLRWQSFACIAHSVGYLIAMLYNHLYPGKVEKMVNIDPVFAVSQYYHMDEAYEVWFKWFYEYYYDHYHMYNSAPSRAFSRNQLIETAMAKRRLSRQQAEVLLSRSLVPVGHGLYRLSTQPLMRRLLFIPAYKDALLHVLTHNAPLVLNLHGVRTEMTKEEREFARNFFVYEHSNPRQIDVYINGFHDLHLTHAQELAPHIEKFLKSDSVLAKL